MAAQDSGESNKGARIANIGTVVSAIMASSCCWLPPILIVFGISGASMLATIEEYRWVMMTVTFGFLGTAFYFTYRPKKGQAVQEDCCAPPISGGRRRFNMMTMNKIMLWGVTAMAVVFLFFPQIVTAMLTPDAGEFTNDMTRTTLSIQGMTCPG